MTYFWKCINSGFNNSKRPELRTPKEIRFLNLILLSGLTFYEFGYHVHEKAILLIIPAMIPLIFAHIDYAHLFLLLSVSGYYSLFPLLYQEAESMLKLLLMAMHIVFSVGALNSRYERTLVTSDNKIDVYNSDENQQQSVKFLSLSDWKKLSYICGFIFVQIIYSLLPYVFTNFFQRFSFLPLMIISLYCFFGIAYTYYYLFKRFFLKLNF